MWLVVVGLILAIVLIIVLSQVKISVSVADSIFVKIKYLFFTVYSYDNETKQEIKEDAKTLVKEKDDIKSTITKITNCSNNYDRLIVLVKMLKSLLLRFKKLLKHTVVKKFNFNITVCGDDAADTAIKYGNVCSVIYPLSTLLCSCVNFKPENISVFSDFYSEETEFNLNFIVSARVIHLLGFAVSSVFDILKLRMGVKSK